jgi:chemotaxis protein MotB
MSPPRDSERPEIVIIRRRQEFDTEVTKSGIWKIAHADFMTALMAFFLVMWLINAAPQQARESIASYFNPIKLAEATADKKGIRDPQNAEAKGERAAGTSDTDSDKPSLTAKGRAPRYDEAVLFRDPYAVLSDIAGRDASAQRRTETALGERTEPGQKGGAAYRDPFDPIYWQVTPRTPTESEPPQGPTGNRTAPSDDKSQQGESEGLSRPDGTPDATGPAIPVAISPEGEPTTEPPSEAEPKADPKAEPKTESKTGSKTESKTGAGPLPERKGGVPPPARRPAGEPGGLAQAPDGEAVQLQAAIDDALKRGGAPMPSVEVRQTDDGILISLTDNAKFSMFAIGSAEPQPELVATVDKITPLLARRSGSVVIRGHTDNRPFRSPTYDNWRLSTARAHMAYHMLIRGGLPETRIERVEGYADRRPLLSDDPAAAQNRRIEILLREKKI